MSGLEDTLGVWPSDHVACKHDALSINQTDWLGLTFLRSHSQRRDKGVRPVLTGCLYLVLGQKSAVGSIHPVLIHSSPFHTAGSLEGAVEFLKLQFAVDL